MILTVTTYLLLLLLPILCVQVFKKPGIALGICWAMLALESVLQQGNSFLLARSSLINIAVALVAAIAATWNILGGKLKNIKWPLSLMLYGALLGLAVLSLAWVPNYSTAFANFKTSAPYIVAFVFIAPLCAVDEKQFRQAVDITIYLGAIILVGIVVSEQGRRGIYLTTIGGKAVESNPLANASYAGIVVICALFSIYQDKKANLILLALRLLIILLGFYTIVKSGSRGQLVALVVSCFVWLPVTAKMAVKKSTIITLIAAFLVLAGSIYLIDDSAWSTRWQWEKIVAAREGRGEAVFTMLGVFAENTGIAWLVGLGSSASYRFLNNTYPHNVPVEVLCEEGLIGFAIFLVLGVSTYVIGWRHLSSTKLSTSGRVMIGILLTMMTFHGLLSLKQGSFLGSSQLFSAMVNIGWVVAFVKSRRAQPSIATVNGGRMRHQNSTRPGVL